eukprot:7731-Eustigmatos_ZCMA.PRE.1
MRETALKNLKQILPRDALQALQYLPDMTELQIFNTHFNDFKTKIAGISFLTPEHFDVLWD